MSGELTKIGPLDLKPTVDTVARLASFKEGALSDEAKYPTDKLATAAGKLYKTVQLLTKMFAQHANDEQIQRMGPALASLLKTLDAKLNDKTNKLTGGAGADDLKDTWKSAFGIKKGGANGDGDALVPLAAPAPPVALVPLAAPAAAGAPAALVLAPPSVVEQAQADLLTAQAQLLRTYVQQVQATSQLSQRRTELAAQIFDQAQPISWAARQANSVAYAVVVEGALVGLLYVGGKGLAGLGMLVAVVMIQVYSAVSHLQVSKVLAGLGSALGAGILSVGTGLGGAVANTVTEMLGMGSVTDDINLPTIATATGAPSGEATVLVEGRGFTPGVAMPPLPPEYAEMKALAEIENLANRIDFFMTRLLHAFFGEPESGKMNAIFFCIASVAFIMLYYLIGHLIDIVDEVRVRRKVDIANAVEFRAALQAPPPLNMGGILGLPAPPRAGGKKRRTVRKSKKRMTRRMNCTVVKFAY